MTETTKERVNTYGELVVNISLSDDWTDYVILDVTTYYGLSHHRLELSVENAEALSDALRDYAARARKRYEDD